MGIHLHFKDLRDKMQFTKHNVLHMIGFVLFTAEVYIPLQDANSTKGYW